jgi:hypothetical protein
VADLMITLPMRDRHVAASRTILVCGLVCQACSALTVRRPTDAGGVAVAGDCTDSYTAPAADTVVAAGLLSAAGFLFADPVDDCEECAPAAGFKKILEVLFGVTAATAGATEAVIAYKGYESVHQCRVIRAHEAACASAGPLGCATPAPPRQ